MTLTLIIKTVIIATHCALIILAHLVVQILVGVRLQCLLHLAHLVGVIYSHAEDLSLAKLEAGSIGSHGLSPTIRVKAVALGGQSDRCGGSLLHHGGLVGLTSMETLLTILVTLTIVLLHLEVSANQALTSPAIAQFVLSNTLRLIVSHRLGKATLLGTIEGK